MTPDADRRIAQLEDAPDALIALPTPDPRTLFPDSRRLQPAVNDGSTSPEEETE